MRERNEAFTELGVYGHTRSWNLSGGENPIQIRGAQITQTLLPTLGVTPIAGRNFRPDEDQPNAQPVVILGNTTWRNQFGSDQSVVGTSIELNGTSREVVGVLPPRFRLPTEFDDPLAADVFIPMARQVTTQPGAGSQNFNLVARLHPGTEVSAGDRNVRETMDYVQSEFGWPEGFTGFALPLHETVVGDVRPALIVLLATVGLVLLIACANVANLMLARSESRGREIAVRVALGAGRTRLVRQLLTESMIFSITGAGVAVALAHFGVKALVAIDPASVPRAEAISTDFTVLGFTAALALITGIVFGLVPAIQSTKSALHSTLKEGSRGSTNGSSASIGRVLATSEVALAFVLAIGAGLLMKSFWNLRSIDSGLEPTNVLTLNTFAPNAEFPTGADVVQFYDALENRVASLPGVSHAALINELPIGGNHYDWSFQIEGQQVAAGQPGPNADYGAVSKDYFQAMGIPVLRGRSFTEFDRDSTGLAVVINQTMADQYWPDDNPLGRRISLGFGPDTWHEIIGVVGNVRSRGLAEQSRAEMFMSHQQMAALGQSFRTMNLVVQATDNPLALVPSIRNVFRELNPNVPFAQVQTVQALVASSLAQERFSMILLVVFASLALSLSAIGIYGVMSYSVAQRSHEIGIRMALGADRTKVRRLIVRQGMKTAAVGIGIGLVLAVGLTRGMRSLLYEVGATDPAIYVGVAVVLLAVAWFSNYVPALRASRGDPVVALRSE